MILLYAFLSHGRLWFQEVPEGFIRKDFLICFMGYGLIATALMLGLVGYLGYLNTDIIRPTRLLIGLLGISLLGYQYIETNSRP